MFYSMNRAASVNDYSLLCANSCLCNTTKIPSTSNVFCISAGKGRKSAGQADLNRQSENSPQIRRNRLWIRKYLRESCGLDAIAPIVLIAIGKNTAILPGRYGMLRRVKARRLNGIWNQILRSLWFLTIKLLFPFAFFPPKQLWIKLRKLLLNSTKAIESIFANLNRTPWFSFIMCL